jgi:PAS domain S-box-containing protein/putative nucleotidyltransferase with HDIG domain
MKKLFIAFLILPGWFLTIAYLTFEYRSFGPLIWGYIFSLDSIWRVIFHAIIFLAPVASTALGIFASDRIRLMDELKELTAKYADYYENAPYGYHSVDKDLKILDVNEAWLRMFGYQRDEVVGKMKISEMLPVKEQENAEIIVRGLADKGRVEDQERVFLKKDGTSVPVLISATAVYDEQGKFVRSRTLVKDDTERKRMNDALRQVADHWSSTFDAMPWGVMLLDRDFHVLRANTFLENHTELDPVGLAASRCKNLHGKAKMKISGNGSEIETNGSYVDEYYDEDIDRYFRMNLSQFGDNDDLIVSVVDITGLKRGEKKLIDSRDAFFNMLKDASIAYDELEEVHTGLIHALANAIDAKSPWTKGHSERVTMYAVTLAEEMGMQHREVEKLRIAALLHDIGKIGTYDYLLDKPTALTDEEFEEIKRHPARAAEILDPIGRLEEIIKVIKYHHEHYDGSGYPEGLKGEAIPKMARILCIADSYDSMTADRPYRQARGRAYALKEMTKCSSTHFDPEMVAVFTGLINEGKI